MHTILERGRDAMDYVPDPQTEPVLISIGRYPAELDPDGSVTIFVRGELHGPFATYDEAYEFIDSLE